MSNIPNPFPVVAVLILIIMLSILIDNENYCEGCWVKCEYDAQDNEIYCEDSDGYWVKYEYDNQGNETYCEHSERGIITGSTEERK